MTKEIVLAFLGWIVLLLMIGILTFFSGSPVIFLCAIVWLMLPILTWLVNFYACKNISVSIQMPTTTSKNEKVGINVIVNNKGWIPVARIFCKIQLENQLTKASEEADLIVTAASKTKTVKMFEVQASHCGYIQVSIAKMYLMDWAGFLPVQCKLKASATMSVLPNTFSPNVYLSISMAHADDAENWSQNQKGNDQSEVFALRDYIEGDSLKQIHWKLSSKRQQLIVREASLPVEKSLLIYWDKNTGEASPEEMDALAECTASVAQAIFAQGISFSFGWTEGKIDVYEDIDTQDQLLQAIPQMIKWGRDIEKGEENHVQMYNGEHHNFGKIIYIAKSVPGDILKFSAPEKTFVVCDSSAHDPLWSVITFEAKNYMTDLETMEL